MATKIYILGIDGGTFDLINPWVAQGKLPAFKEMMEKGVHGHLNSTIPPYTPQAWSSFVTGTNPGKHGIYGFTRHRADAYGIEYINAGARCKPAFWDTANRHGISCGIFNVPMTYPPQPINGFMISGMDAPRPDESIAIPKTLFHEIQREIGPYIVESDAARLFRSGKIEHAVKALKNFIRFQHKAAMHLFTTCGGDVFMAVFSAVDRVQHLFWHLLDEHHLLYDPASARQYGDTIYEIYQMQDEILADVMRVLDDDATLLIMSDHGSGPHNFKQVLSLTQYLIHNGYLVMKKGQRRYGLKGLIRRVYTGARNRLPRGIKQMINHLLPNIRQQVVSSFNFAAVDWSKTTVYADFPFPYLWINLQGRETQGTVAPGKDYEGLRSEVIQQLRQLKDVTTGQDIMDDVFRREDLFWGDQLEAAPDIIAHFANGYLNARDVDPMQHHAPFMGRIAEWEACFAPSGGHRMNGIFMGMGKAFKQGVEVKGMQIADVAPLICYLLGIPIPLHYDGRLVKDLFKPHYVDTHPPTYESDNGEKPTDSAYSPEESAIVEKRLKDLGYV